MRLNGMVHNANPELCQGLIIHATSSLGARKLPYPNGETLQSLFKTMTSQNEPSEPKMAAMSKILRRELAVMEGLEEFSIVHRVVEIEPDEYVPFLATVVVVEQPCTISSNYCREV